MPRNKTLTCYICNEPMWAGKTSRPQGEAAHNKCRSTLSKEERARECVDCGYTFTAKDRRCGPCRYNYAKATAVAPCIECDKPATAKGMCITHYSAWRRANVTYNLTCGNCGVRFTHNRKDRATCSDACRQEFTLSTEGYQSRAIVPRPNIKTTALVLRLKPRIWLGHTVPERKGNALVAGQCEYCPAYFVGAPGSRYCSERCTKNSAWKRRNNRSGKFKVTDKLRLSIYERDAYTCQICLKAVDTTLHHLDMMSATLDHIIPQSHMLIPDHSEQNLRLAHRICNSVRGDRVVTHQPPRASTRRKAKAA